MALPRLEARLDRLTAAAATEVDMGTVALLAEVDEAGTRTDTEDRPCVATPRPTRRATRMTATALLPLAADRTHPRPCEAIRTTDTDAARPLFATTRLRAAAIATTSRPRLPAVDRRWTTPRATSRPAARRQTTRLRAAGTANSPRLPVAAAATTTSPRPPAAVPAGTQAQVPRVPATTTPLAPLPAGTSPATPQLLLLYPHPKFQPSSSIVLRVRLADLDLASPTCEARFGVLDPRVCLVDVLRGEGCFDESVRDGAERSLVRHADQRL